MAKYELTSKERIVNLEANLNFVNTTVQEIKNNHLQHLDGKIDKLGDKVDTLNTKVETIGVKLGLAITVFTTIIQMGINYFLK